MVVAGVTTALLGGGVALAAWSVSGNGDGEAQAIDADEIVVDDQASPTAGLFPGGQAGVTVRVQNPLPYPVTLTHVTYGAVTTTGGGSCDSDVVTPTGSGAVPLGTPISLAKESAFTPVTIPAALEMSTEATDNCKGATFSVDVTFSGESADS